MTPFLDCLGPLIYKTFVLFSFHALVSFTVAKTSTKEIRDEHLLAVPVIRCVFDVIYIMMM